MDYIIWSVGSGKISQNPPFYEALKGCLRFRRGQGSCRRVPIAHGDIIAHSDKNLDSPALHMICFCKGNPNKIYTKIKMQRMKKLSMQLISSQTKRFMFLKLKDHKQNSDTFTLNKDGEVCK